MSPLLMQGDMGGSLESGPTRRATARPLSAARRDSPDVPPLAGYSGGILREVGEMSLRAHRGEGELLVKTRRNAFMDRGRDRSAEACSRNVPPRRVL